MRYSMSVILAVKLKGGILELTLAFRVRFLLRELRFTQVQKSVWQSEYDVLEYLVPELRRHNLQEYVQLYESAQVT